jgi:hypothetical protein
MRLALREAEEDHVIGDQSRATDRTRQTLDLLRR